MDQLGGVGFIKHMDANALSNSGPQHGPRELIVVGSGYKSVIFPQLNLTPADTQDMNNRFRGKHQGAEARARHREARQLQEGPASEQAG